MPSLGVQTQLQRTICTIDESVKGAASQNRYGITFDGNIDVLYNFQWLNDSYLKMGKNNYQ